MDTVTKLLIIGLAICLLLIVVLLIISLVLKKKEKQSVNVDEDGEVVAEKPKKQTKQKKVPKAEEEPTVDTSNIMVIDPAMAPFINRADFLSEETEGTKFEQFNTVAASEVATEITSVHEATGFNIIYKGCFTADMLLYKFYYIKVSDSEVEGGEVFYVIYESGVNAFAFMISESQEEVDADYLINKLNTN